MQRILQINIAGRVLPIEEDAYAILKDYINNLERQFAGETGREEIIQDIESRIAELFSIRLQNNVPAIDRADVNKVIETLGQPADFSGNSNNAFNRLPTPYINPQKQQNQQQQYNNQYQTNSGQRRLFRNPNDKMLGGVCSGLANYFDVDPVIVRLVWVMCVFLAGAGLLAYIIAWVVIPIPRTPQDFAYMSDGQPLNFHDITKNVGNELQDLKKRGEEMSKELRDFFSKKK